MDADLLKEFLQESFEGLEQLDNDIVALEKEPQRGDLMSAIFRAIHTIKGSCGFMSLQQLEAVAHATETVLGKMRDGVLPVTSDVISDVLTGVDLIKELLGGIEKPVDWRAAQTLPRHVAEPDARLLVGETLDAVHTVGAGEARWIHRPRAIGRAAGKPHGVVEASCRV